MGKQIIFVHKQIRTYSVHINFLLCSLFQEFSFPESFLNFLELKGEQFI